MLQSLGMRMNNRDDGIERRQLEAIQRIGRIGYWEYEAPGRSLSLPAASLNLLASITENTPDAPRSLTDALCADERKRFQSALDQALDQRLPLNIEVKLASDDERPCYIVVRGVPAVLGDGRSQLVGTFQDISEQGDATPSMKSLSLSCRPCSTRCRKGSASSTRICA